MSTDVPERARLTRVRLSYGGTAGARALDGIDLSVAPGTLTALVGPNGSGKSSLLGVLAGRLEPQEGEVQVVGMSRPARLRGRARRGLHARVSFVSQDPELDPEMGVLETLHLLATLYGLPRAERRGAVQGVLEQFRLVPHAGKRVAELSGGLRRRLHLAGALLHTPDLLLLDEPGAGLDREGRDALWALLAEQSNTGRSVLVVTHDLEAVEARAQRVCVLEQGRLVQDGTPRELAGDSGSLVDALRGRVGRVREPESSAGRGRGSRGGAGRGGGAGARGGRRS